MAIKSEIAWSRPSPEGFKIHVYARRYGGEWQFHTRLRRSEPWVPLPEPPLEDWNALLDAVRRRVPRRLFPPAEVVRIERMIRERFPDSCL